MAPAEGEHVTGTTPFTSSVAVAVKLTTLPALLVASSVRVAGRVSTGGVTSATGRIIWNGDREFTLAHAKPPLTVVATGMPSWKIWSPGKNVPRKQTCMLTVNCTVV